MVRQLVATALATCLACASAPIEERALVGPSFRAAGHFTRNDARLRCLSELLRAADVSGRRLELVVFPLAGPEELQQPSVGMIVGAFTKANPASGPIRIQTAEEDTSRYHLTTPLYAPDQAGPLALKGQIEVHRGVVFEDLELGFGISGNLTVDAGIGARRRFDVMVLRLYPVILKTREVLDELYVEIASAYPALVDGSVVVSAGSSHASGTAGGGGSKGAPTGRVAEHLIGMAVFEVVARYFALPAGCSDPTQASGLELAKALPQLGGDEVSALVSRHSRSSVYLLPSEQLRGDGESAPASSPARAARPDHEPSTDPAHSTPGSTGRDAASPGAVDEERTVRAMGGVRSPDEVGAATRGLREGWVGPRTATKIGVVSSPLGVTLVPNGSGFLYCYGLGSEKRLQRLRLIGLGPDDRAGFAKPVIAHPPAWVGVLSCFLTSRSAYEELAGLAIRDYQLGFYPHAELQRIYKDIDPNVVYIVIRIRKEEGR